MARTLRTTLVALLASLALAGTAQASGGDYVIEGGSAEAQATVRAALDASRFDFDRVPVQITIRISSCGCAGARPGLIVLDEAVLLDESLGEKYSWGLIQHEYAHHVTTSSSQTPTAPRSASDSAARTGATRSTDSGMTSTPASGSPTSSAGPSGLRATTSSAPTARRSRPE
jgi:hypothetical protein